MGLPDLMQALGEEIQDPEEESFLLFAQADRSHNLGFIDQKANCLEICVAGRDLIIEQSPSLLTSDRAEGTTGAVVWKITPLFADWISGKANPLFVTETLGSSSTVLELGCGVSGIVALTTSPKVGRYIATDQEYVFKMLRSNLKENAAITAKPSMKAKQPRMKSNAKSKSKLNTTPPSSNIETIALDWESSSISSLPNLLGLESHAASARDTNGVIDAVLACDCIYNEALINPFVQTCIDICSLASKSTTKAANSTPPPTPTICIIAQQLRSHPVFETWLLAFHTAFRVWKVPDRWILDARLGEGSGYVIHIGILR